MQFIITPSHGYLVVPKEKFYPVYEALTEEEKQSFGYGYADMNNVYLEEDCEATIFMKHTGLKSHEIEEHYTEGFDTARRITGVWLNKPLYNLNEVLKG